MTTCPQCGYERTTEDDSIISNEECPKCGIIYKKLEMPTGLKRPETILVHKAPIRILGVFIRFFLVDCFIFVAYLIYAFLDYNDLNILKWENIADQCPLIIIIGAIVYSCRTFVKKSNRIFTFREINLVAGGFIIIHLIVVEAIIKGYFFDLIRFYKFNSFFHFFPPELFYDWDPFRILSVIIIHPIVIYFSVVVAGRVGKKQTSDTVLVSHVSEGTKRVLTHSSVSDVNNNLKITSKKPILICVILIVITITFFIVVFMHSNKTSASVGRFIANTNGTVLDKKTNLMWAAKDNGADIDWINAKLYCENYRGGGYTDWRMPTQNELAELLDKRKSRPAECRTSCKLFVATNLIDITCMVAWTSEINEYYNVKVFTFDYGRRTSRHQVENRYSRILPVRSAK